MLQKRSGFVLAVVQRRVPMMESTSTLSGYYGLRRTAIRTENGRMLLDVWIDGEVQFWLHNLQKILGLDPQNDSRSVTTGKYV